MLDFDAVYEKICNDYVEDYGNISYHIAEKGSFGSNRPKTLYIDINEENYEDDPFCIITTWLFKNVKAYKTTCQCEEYHFDDFDVIINIIKE